MNDDNWEAHAEIIGYAQRTPAPSPTEFSDALQYAMSWFVYHAQQRTQTFYFFVVIQAALVTGVAVTATGLDRWAVMPFAGAGLVSALLFLLLEVRNTELVNAGRAALDALERHALTALEPYERPRVRDQWRFDLWTAAQDGRRWPAYRHSNSTFILKKRTVWRAWPKRCDPSWLAYFARHGFVLRTLLYLSAAAWIAVLAATPFV